MWVMGPLCSTLFDSHFGAGPHALLRTRKLSLWFEVAALIILIAGICLGIRGSFVLIVQEMVFGSQRRPKAVSCGPPTG